MSIQTINPSNGKIVQTFEQHSSKQVNEIIGLTHEAFLNWRNAGFSVRKVFMKKASAILREKKNEFGKILTLEMGKPIIQAIAEVEKCALVCDYYAENTENILSEEIIATDASESFVRFDPIGIVLAVMPWNFPFWQVFRFAAPALMAGNACLLKHASNVPMSALAIEEIFSQAGFPQNVFRTLLIGSSEVEEVINHPKIKAATLTGSEPAGKKVAESCGKVLKKTVLELGGSDPFIVLEDADIDTAVKIAITARLINNGQSCIAAKRFIVVEKVYDEFEKKFVQLMEKIKIGDPMNPETELGPIAREDLLCELEDQVKRSTQSGAKILCGGKRIEREGFYFEATILANVLPGTPAYEEEIFGPVASLIKAKDEEEAIRIANDSEFGLGASLWTANIEKAKLLAARIEGGSVFINGMVKSDPRLPFGGIKNSGYGREISHYGIKEFVNIKTVWIK
ncbi:MAG: NAD-dependent succinate-semialdehyde dehydrogenase [Ignavibacteriales bacterium]|nr:NAD-dependent succinate-semialdehyde dehydrogenase [Ignavibacteriales bacterium]